VSERFWERVLQRLDEETVVPVLGPDLLTVADEATETLLYPLLAKKLAAHLDVSSEDLPGGTELQEVSRRFLTHSRDVQEIYRCLRVVFRELDPIPIPAPLLDLARISRFSLFVTTTFDVLIERAVDHVRFDGQRQTLAFAYAPSDRQDLPPEFDRLGRPGVFHLLGRLSGTPHSFAVTGEDTLEFMDSLQSRAPGFLFDKLRESDLLILGSRLSDWLARLLAQGGPGLDAPVLFVERAKGTTEAVGVESPVDFVGELYRRWSEFSPQEDTATPPIASPLETPAGSVFLSCAGEDRSAAESIREALDRAGIDVILDQDDLPLAPRWEKRLKSAVGLCSVFVPVISAPSLKAKRRFLQGEWLEAILEAGRAAPTGRFVLPVVIDDTSPGDPAIPGEFGELQWEKLPGGKPSSEFVRKLVELQRSYRRAKYG
jgi:TIR domain/SIR2-like domain